MADTTLFYRDKPVFGFDLGFNSVKLMQIDTSGKKHQVVGYGYTSFDNKAVKDGVIVDPESVAKAVYELVTKQMIGTLDTKRVAANVPAARTYNRVLTLPMEQRNDLDEAVRQEAEQYIPIPVDQLYIDYEVVGVNKDKGVEVLVVAVPKNLVESYMVMFGLLGLEVATLETSIASSTRLVMHAERTTLPTLIIDFGSISTDLSIFDTTLRVTGTVDAGGDTITQAIAKELGVTPREAHIIKTKHGLSAGKKQAQIIKALEPMLTKLVAETKKMVRFYQERSGEERKLEQVVILGGGANMPGLADYLTDKIRIPTRVCDPWMNLQFGSLQPPHPLEKTLYATSAGLALLMPKELHDD